MPLQSQVYQYLPREIGWVKLWEKFLVGLDRFFGFSCSFPKIAVFDSIIFPRPTDILKSNTRFVFRDSTINFVVKICLRKCLWFLRYSWTILASALDSNFPCIFNWTNPTPSEQLSSIQLQSRVYSGTIPVYLFSRGLSRKHYSE